MLSLLMENFNTVRLVIFKQIAIWKRIFKK